MLKRKIRYFIRKSCAKTNIDYKIFTTLKIKIQLTEPKTITFKNFTTDCIMSIKTLHKKPLKTNLALGFIIVKNWLTFIDLVDFSDFLFFTYTSFVFVLNISSKLVYNDRFSKSKSTKIHNWVWI